MNPSLKTRLAARFPSFAFWAVFAAVWGSPPLEAYKLQYQELRPKQFFIGQIVQLTLGIELSEGEELAAPTQLPSNLDYRIHDITIHRSNALNSYEVDIRFSAYTTDSLRFVPLHLGNVRLSQLTVPRAQSSLGANPGANPRANPRANFGYQGPPDTIMWAPSLESRPFSLPWVDLSIAFLLQIIVLLPIVLLQSSKQLRHLWQRLWEHWQRRKPYRQFQHQLSLLQQSNDMPSMEYYRIISSQLRYYLSHRTPHPCVSYTTEELGQIEGLLQSFPLWQQVLEILHLSDAVRFGHTHSPTQHGEQRSNRQHELQVMLNFAKMVEKQDTEVSYA